MVEKYNHHPKMMKEAEKRRLPERVFHHTLQDRYPSNSTIELNRRAQDFFYRALARFHGNLDVLKDFSIMQPYPKLLDNMSSPFDVVAPTLIIDQGENKSAIVIMEDHVHQDLYDYSMGKSTIVQKLLGMSSMDEFLEQALDLAKGEKILPFDLANKLPNLPSMTNRPNTATNFQLLSGDVTFFAKSQSGILSALPTVATREDTVWDLTRSGIRRIINTYDRKDINIRRSQIDLSEKLKIDESVWAESTNAYPIKDIILIREDPSLQQEAAWGEDPVDEEANMTELQTQLYQNPLYLRSTTNYWDIDPQNHIDVVNSLVSDGLYNAPRTRQLHIRSPRNVQHLYYAAELIKNLYLEAII